MKFPVVPEEKIYDIIRDMKCERCKNENNQIKSGRTKSGNQKYKCKHYEPVFKIFVHAFNRFALAEFLYPSLKSAFAISHIIWIYALGTPWNFRI